jgi:hypothetical protein
VASVSDDIRRLRFVSSPAPAVYLNEPLVRETFIAHLGAIDSFTRAADRELRAGLGSVISVGGSRTTQEQIDYDLTDPITQALVLHSALGAEGKVAAPQAGTSVGSFVEAVGSAYFPALLQPPSLPPELASVAEVVQAECERQTEVARGFGNSGADFVALLISGNSLVSASIIDRGNVRPNVAASYLAYPQICFGLMERLAGDLPFITLLYMRAYV